MKALKIKDGFKFLPFFQPLKNSAKRVIVAQRECRLAQLEDLLEGRVR
jgi:hypothetical protein